MNLAHGLQQQILQGRVQLLSYEHAVAGGQQIDVHIGDIAAQAEETSRQHDALEPGNRLGDCFGLCDVHQPDPRCGERTLHDVSIQLAGKYRDIDVACDQSVDTRAIVEVDQVGGRIQGVACLQHTQNQRA
jgi:hypothetical protein